MLTLPRGSSESERQLAQRVARQLGTEDLHVFWSDGPPPPPVRLPPLPSMAQGLSALDAVIDAISAVFGSRRSRSQRPLA